MATTTNMNLVIPTVSVTSGPSYATQINTAFDGVDSHDHTTGKGVQVPSAGININATLEFNSNAASELTFLNLESQSSPPGTNQSVYVDSSNDLYYINTTGTSIQITNGAVLASVGSGVITYSAKSSFPYSVVTGDAQKVLGIPTGTANTLNFPAATNVMAFWIKDITGTANTNNITLSPNGSDTIEGVNADYILNEDFTARMIMSDGVSAWHIV